MRAWRWVCAAAQILTIAHASLSSRAVTTAKINGAVSDDRVWEGDAIAATASLSVQGPAPDDEDLLTWAERERLENATRTWSAEQTCQNCFLIVGVKTRAVQGFAARQVIRAAWANPTAIQPLHTRVAFLGCEPNLEHKPHANAAILHALELEKKVYGDLLTTELGGCVDAYDRLADKVLGFFYWVSVHHPTAAYVMVADDDGYVRLDRITVMLKAETTPRKRYYAGQVLASQLRRAMPTMRDRTSKYQLSPDQYAMSTLPPFAIGAHYLLSSDVVAFVARNRRGLCSTGTLEDVSVGFWLLSLLQVRPVDVASFRCTTQTLCHNSFSSYGELSRASILRIHSNLQRGDPFCDGFSFESWATLGIKEPPRRKLRPREDTAYDWAFRVCTRTRSLRVDVTVRLQEALEALTLPSVSFTPAIETFGQFCSKLDGAAATLERRLPLMMCDDLLRRLREFLPQHPLSQTALLALLRSNLPPLVVMSAAVKVWLSRGVLRWRAFIESLMADIYPDVQVLVVDEITARDVTNFFDPDLAVVTATQTRTLPDLPRTCRHLVLSTAPRDLDHAHLITRDGEDEGTIFLTSDRHDNDWRLPRHQLYVPVASLIFSDTQIYSPRALLQASSERRPHLPSSQQFAVPHYNRRAAALLQHLKDAAPGNCTLETARSDPAIGNTVFAFDADVTRYSTARFVLAFETAQARPGYVAETIVAAFLAGSIPVYDGDDNTISRLFNPKAFISCGRFPSLKACADFVAELRGSPSLYAQMRSEPPVADMTAFYELFSWHPDVRDLSPGNKVDDLSMAERLRAMINRG